MQRGTHELPLEHPFGDPRLSGGAGQFLLKFLGDSEIHGPNEATRTTYRNNSIGPILGFNKQDLGNAASHTSQSKPNLSSDRSIYMYINTDRPNFIDGLKLSCTSISNFSAFLFSIASFSIC